MCLWKDIKDSNYRYKKDTHFSLWNEATRKSHQRKKVKDTLRVRFKMKWKSQIKRTYLHHHKYKEENPTGEKAFK